MTKAQSLMIQLTPLALLAVVAAWLVLCIGAVAGAWRPSASWVTALVASVLLLTALSLWSKRVRERFLRESALPRFLQRKLRETYPHFSSKDCELVERGLRQFFLACARSKKQFVAMPSRAVDTLWHEFILHTQAYKRWCDLGLGFFLHHTPAEALGKQAQRNDGLRRAWYWACKEEAIDPKKPSRLPLLFALDAKLGIANGFHYLPDCSDIRRKGDGDSNAAAVHCGTSFSDGSFSGESDSFGGADSSDGGGGGGDGGGCGGGGD